VTLGPAEDDHGVGRPANVGSSFDGIPEKVTGGKNVLTVAKGVLDGAVEEENPLEMQSVVTHQFAVVGRIVQFPVPPHESDEGRIGTDTDRTH
jgi:hypothetical protein